MVTDSSKAEGFDDPTSLLHDCLMMLLVSPHSFSEKDIHMLVCLLATSAHSMYQTKLVVSADLYQ